ncbi:MAG: hypothetical protein ACE5KM_23180 [Planctomycetaceae bacterium]
MGNLTCSLMLFAQQSVTQTKPGAEAPPLLSPWWVGLIVMLVLALPFLLGNLIARGIKMKDLASKIGVMLLVTELGLAPFVSQYVLGWLERGQHAKEMTVWEKKQKFRDQITAEGIGELKKKVPGVEVRWESRKNDKAASKP